MYVKKFEGDSLDEALKAVKAELGPDAIILKTVTNKGLKGAFKKRRIEITAAISEQSYAKKARIDHVLSHEQKDQFYQSSAVEVNKSINRYEENRTKAQPASPAGYGSLGLNKVVQTVSKASDRIKHSLDEFLAVEEAPKAQEIIESSNLDAFLDENMDSEGIQISQPVKRSTSPTEVQYKMSDEDIEANDELRQQVKSQMHKIDLLEKKLFELAQKLTDSHSEENIPAGLKSLRLTLKSLGLSEKIVHKVLRKAQFELNKKELEDTELLDDFALRELSELINTQMPLFSQADVQEKPVVTALISESSCGQASMAKKLAALHENVKIIRFRQEHGANNNSDFVEKVFKLDVSNVSTLSHLMSEARKAIEENKSIILDLRFNFKEVNESKKFIETLKRSFDQIEFLVTVSGIQTELYNQKIITKYKPFVGGVIISYVDQCLSFGSLVNVHVEHNELPLKFFGTGAVIPDDIEAATAERLLAGLFRL
ncbi:MAG: hypothetical protein OEW87_10190 [Flavobacteriaceae bacterium]|nr:hypothetical protein [Flavobacteriaceae bacterium]